MEKLTTLGRRGKGNQGGRQPGQTLRSLALTFGIGISVGKVEMMSFSQAISWGKECCRTSSNKQNKIVIYTDKPPIFYRAGN